MQHRNSLRIVNMITVLSCLLALTYFLTGAPRVSAQKSSAAQANRNSAAYGSSVRLPGHTPRRVLDGTAMRVGHYNPEQKLRLAVALQPPHMAEEEQFLTELQTKGSPNFHKFLSAEEWNDRFGPSAEDEQKLVDWAQSQDLIVTNRFANRLLVDLEAPAGVIEKVFGVSIDNYQVGGEVDFSNDRDPMLPASLSGIVRSVLGLNSIQRVHGALPYARTRKGPDYAEGPVRADVRSSQGDGDPARAPWNHPEAEAADKSAAPLKAVPIDNGGWDPASVFSSEAYDYTALYNQGHCCNVHHDASGAPADTSIALVTFGDFLDNDVATFFKQYGMAWLYNVYSVDGTSGSPGKECITGSNGCPEDATDDEAPLDVEYSTATANSFGSSNDTAHVYVYEGVNGLYTTYADIYNFILTDNHAHVVSTSYGGAEEGYDQGGFVNGSAAGDIHPIFNAMVGQGWTLVAAAGDNGSSDGCIDAVQVDWPAADPDFVAAGGSELSLNNDGTWAGEVAWTGGTGSKSCQTNGGGGGGGESIYFSQPSWQSGLGGKGGRLMPDISLEAGGPTWQWYYCSDSGCKGQTWSTVGGTSIVAPELAGFFAQENAYLNYIGHICGSNGTTRCEPIGNPNPVIYEEARRKNAAHDPFYDITQGCNTNNITAKYGLTYFCAQPGYDQATGWGSANMLQLAWALNWEIIPAIGVPYVTFSGPATNKWYNTNQTVSWTIHDYEPANSTPGSGIAGETQGWDSIPSDPSGEPHGGSGNSFWDGPQFPNGSTGCLAFEPNGCSGGVSQGCHTAWARGWNNQGESTAGNSSYPESYGPICYDTVAPTINVVNNPASPTSTGWYTSPVMVTLTATDPGGSGASGVANIYFGLNNSSCETWDAGACAKYGSSLNVNAQGTQSIIAFSEDNAGNFSPPTSEALLIDYTPPATTAGFNGTTSGQAWVNSVSIVLKATDNVSGVASTYYTIDGGARNTYTAPFAVSTIGNHTLNYWSVDVAGNTERANSDTFLVASSTTSTLTTSPNPSVNGQAVTLKATVTATDQGTPTGQVSFVTSAAVLGTVALSGGTATFTTSKLPVGSYGIGVTFNGTTNFLNSVSAGVTQVVNETTTTTLSASPNPAAYGSKVTFTAKVKPSISGTPTGTVTFNNGRAQIGSAPVDGNGVASFSTSALEAGKHSITGSYSGDSTYVGSKSGALPETITKAASATALKSSAASSFYNESVTFTATVTSAGGTPTGNVTFLDKGSSLGTGSIVDGVATFVTNTLAVGTHSITATYTGSADFDVSNSSAVSEVIAVEDTTTKVTSSLNPSEFGEYVTFTATVKAATAGTPVGTVTFLSNGTSIGTGTLSNGVATYATYQLPVGTDSITAAYVGSFGYKASTSAVLSQVVDVQPTTMDLKSSPNPSTYGENVTFTATLKSAAVVSPNGTVTFLSKGISVGTGQLVNGVATLKTAGLPVGTSSITATFPGNAGFKASTSAAVSQVVNAEATTSALTSSPNPSTVGESVTFTATVKAAAGVPDGKVTFKDGTASLGTETLSGGTATLATTALTAGTHTIAAVFGGSTGYLTSTSAPLTQTVNAATTAKPALARSSIGGSPGSGGILAGNKQ